MTRSRALFLLLMLTAGCRSFDETIKPILNPTTPEGYVPPVYIKGVRSITNVDPNDLSLDVWRVNADTYPDSVRLYVRVFDRQHNLVTNLAPPYYQGGGDYRTIWSGLSERLAGVGEQRVTDFTVREFSDRDGIPYELALVLDYSGSMTSSVSQIEDAARAFIRLKRPQDRISIVKFGREAKLAIEASSSESELLAELDDVPGTNHGYYSAMYSAAHIAGTTVAQSPDSNPRAIVVFTDGEDNASSSSPTDIFMLSKQKNIPVFAVGFGAMNREVLADLTTYTSGRLYQTYTPDELRAAFEDIYRSLRNYYLISYKPPQAPGKHVVTVSLDPPGMVDKTIAATAEYNTILGVLAPDTGVVGEMRAVQFAYNQSTLLPESIPSIAAVAALMLERPRMKIEVRGHTDAQGTPEYNQKLSEDRAEAVRVAIVERGIEASRVRSRGFGLTRPIASNETEEGRALNRRTEFVVLAR